MIELNKITAGYGLSPVIKEVSLKVEDGKLVSLVGSNGAGKSTVCKVISGLLKSIEGKIFLNGVDLTALPTHRIVEMGVIQVPEGRRLFPSMNVKDNLLMGGRNARAKKHISSSLEMVFQLFPVLKERQNQAAATFSGGQQQMLALGRGLMAMPKVLVIDELSLGLAPMLVMDMFHSLEKLKRQGMTILLVEQNVKLALKISDYSYVLENGSIILSGDGNTLLEDQRIKKAFLGM